MEIFDFEVGTSAVGSTSGGRTTSVARTSARGRFLVENDTAYVEIEGKRHPVVRAKGGQVEVATLDQAPPEASVDEEPETP
jgi:hypothetical protein